MPIVFIHIPKSGGTTLNEIIERQYQPQEVCSLYPSSDSLSPEEQEELRNALSSKSRLIRGHLPFGEHLLFDESVRYFTVLREPIERTISHYYYVRAQSQYAQSHYSVFRQMSLQACLENKVSIVLDNAQTRILSGVSGRLPFGALSRETLDQAKHNLANYMDVVGLVERFDETLLLLQKTLGWRNVCYTQHNVNRIRPQKVQLSVETLQTITEVNQLDLELYQYARSLFERQILQQGLLFPMHVALFRLQNRFDGYLAQRCKHSLIKTLASPSTSLRARILVEGLPPALPTGQRVFAQVVLKNIGGMMWPSFPHRSTGYSYVTIGIKLCRLDGSVISDTLDRTRIPHDVHPGEEIRTEISFRLADDLLPGAYKLRFDMVYEHLTWFERVGSAVFDHHFSV